MDAYGNPHGWDDAMHPAATVGGGAGMMHPSMMTLGLEKARLTKDQIDYLEGRFAEQHKPTTMDKKGIASLLGVSLDKINNWFQNRRAKEKQEVKKRENARAIMEEASINGMQPSPESYIPTHPIIQSFGSSDSLGHAYSAPQTYMPSGLDIQTLSADATYQHVDSLSFSSMFPGVNASAPEHYENGVVLAAHDHIVGQPPSLLLQDPAHVYNLRPTLPEDTTQFAHLSNAPHQDLRAPVVALSDDINQPFQLQADYHPMGSLSVQPVATGNADQLPPSAQLMSVMSSFQANGHSVAPHFNVPGWSPDSSSQSPLATENPSPADSGPTGSDSTVTPPVHFEAHDSWQTTASSALAATHRQNFQANQGPSRQASISHGQLSLPGRALDEALGHAPERRDSSASVLAETMSGVGISTGKGGDAEFKQPGQPSSLAARRRGPRPAALGMASLRSVSYSAGMPQSPGAIAALQAPDQALRRIRSTGLVNGRINKVLGSGQRSPMHPTFAEAAASPKFMRTASMQASVSSPTTSIGTNSLAPPTPSTPGFHLWPSWHHGTPGESVVHSPDADPIGQDVINWSNDGMDKSLLLTVSSPPETPYYAQQLARYQATLSQHMNSQARDTPPQSAPATQLRFPSNVMGPPAQPWLDTLPESQPKTSYLRRPSLPAAAQPMPLSQLQKVTNWPHAVPFNAPPQSELSTPMLQGMDSNGLTNISQADHMDASVFTNPNPFQVNALTMATASAAGIPYHQVDPSCSISPSDPMASRQYYFATTQGPHDYNLST